MVLENTRLRISLLTALALGLLLSLMTVQSLLASAGIDITDESGLGYIVIQIPMDADCSQIPDTEEAHAMLAERGLCGYDKIEEEISPQATTCGNCGCLTLQLYNDPQPGWMHWQTTITSSQGAMVSASFAGDWHNFATGGGGPVSRSSGPIFTTSWQSDVPILTGAGYVRGEIPSGAAQSLTWWGLVCTNPWGVHEWQSVQ